MLWADTFNNYYHPDVAKAAVEVLEAAGFVVQVPQADLCCGRPLYDYGFLDLAKRRLEEILGALEEQIQSGTPMVVLEPSCCAVFRDELSNLFPNHELARKLRAQTFVLSEFLLKKAPHFQFQPLNRKALVHGHCHHKAIMGFKDEEQVLKKLGLDCRVPEPGCCGMAGAFGFEEGDHYQVSIKCGEKALLPAVRQAADEELIVADGFSCMEQIMTRTDRVPLHLAQVIQMSLHQSAGLNGRANESAVVRARKTDLRSGYRRTGVMLVSAAALGLLLWKFRSKSVVRTTRSSSDQPLQS
jgi:Fe-S oxidoreductase